MRCTASNSLERANGARRRAQAAQSAHKAERAATRFVVCIRAALVKRRLFLHLFSRRRRQRGELLCSLFPTFVLLVQMVPSLSS